jgi:hypothetical protein
MIGWVSPSEVFRLMNATDKSRALWAQAFRQPSVWRRAVRLGLSVGLLQATINQGDHWLNGAVDRAVVIKSLISPLIGFTLVLFSAAETWVQRTATLNTET